MVADETYLSNAEVCILLTKQKEMRAAQGLRVTEEFEKTLSATTRFSGIDRPQEPAMMTYVQELRQELMLKRFERESETDPGTLENVTLTQFEIGALSNLMPGDPEEAFALLPGLTGRFTEEDIQEVCDVIERIRTQTTML